MSAILNQMPPIESIRADVASDCVIIRGTVYYRDGQNGLLQDFDLASMRAYEAWLKRLVEWNM